MLIKDKASTDANSEREDREAAAKAVRQAAAKAVIMLMGEKWKAPFVPRSKVKSFTGGLYSPGHLANCDTLNTGPDNSFKIGRQRVYPVLDLCNWLILKVET